MKQLPVNREGAQHADNPQDQGKVCDVAANDVANGQVGPGAALEICEQADDQFRQTCAERHNGQADYDQRHIKAHGKAARTADKKIGSAGEECEADKKEEDIEN